MKFAKLRGLASLIVLSASPLAMAQTAPVDGYLYPAPVEVERVSTIAALVETAPPELRTQIMSQASQMQTALPYAPLLYANAEGPLNETMVITTFGDFAVDTKFKARAAVAHYTTLIRNNPLFVEYGVENYATLFDLLKIWGFRQLVVTDGDAYSYAFVIE